MGFRFFLSGLVILMVLIVQAIRLFFAVSGALRAFAFFYRMLIKRFSKFLIECGLILFLVFFLYHDRHSFLCFFDGWCFCYRQELV